MPRILKHPFTLFAFWLLTSLVSALFHEPWRDEAQAWLIARNAPDFYEILIRSSVEASGPLYYFLLRPWAIVLPNAFPSAVFWVSFAGMVLFAWDFSRTPWIPLLWRWGILGGFLFGYEYAVTARLYGWGCFFLWRGICEDRKDHPRAILWLSFACLTQLSFLFSTLGWCTYRVLQHCPIKRYFFLTPAIALLAAHVSLGAPYRHWEWVPWNGVAAFFKSLGTTLAVPLLQGPHLDFMGILFFAIFLLPLNKNARAAFSVAIAFLIFIFVFRYRGTAEPRHGGALFVLYLALLAENFPLSKGKRNLVLALFILNLATGLGMRIQDGIFRFGDGMAAAEAIRQRSQSTAKPPRVYINKGEESFVIAARLGIVPWHRGAPLEGPFFPGATRAWKKETPPLPDLQAGIEFCAKDHTCFFALHPAEPAPKTLSGGEWTTLYFKPRALREPIAVYEFRTHAGSP